MIGWMTDLRKGTESRQPVFHDLRIGGTFTVCGRPSYSHGHIVTLERAESVYDASRCRTCKGENQRFGPDDSVKGRAT